MLIMYYIDYMFTCQGDQGCSIIYLCTTIEEIAGDCYLSSQDAIDREQCTIRCLFYGRIETQRYTRGRSTITGILDGLKGNTMYMTTNND